MLIKIKRRGGKTMYKAYFDGASKGNPGEAAIGACIENSNNNIIWSIAQRIGVRTNNEAEYAALIELLLTIFEKELKNVTIYGDSQLVINQMNGVYQVNSPNLKQLHRQAKYLADYLKARQNITLVWIPRKENMKADKLSNMAFEKTI